jgi:hypothetical protein
MLDGFGLSKSWNVTRKMVFYPSSVIIINVYYVFLEGGLRIESFL